MKKVYVFTALFLFVGALASLNAQDLIVMRNGSVITAKVMEIRYTEISYKRFDNLDGPTVIVPVSEVLSIRYENGTQDIMDANNTYEVQTYNATSAKITAMDPGKTTVGFSIDPSGFLLYGPSLALELTSGSLNTQLHFRIPSFGLTSNIDGFVLELGVGWNYFYHTRLGGFYIGVLMDFSVGRHYGWYDDGEEWEEGYIGFDFGMNIGYKFVFSTGAYIRTGINLGVGGVVNETEGIDLLLRPEVSFGYSF